jgi:hypothetical protein
MEDGVKQSPVKPVQYYRVQVFVDHGYFEYEVTSVEKAMAHAQAIMSTGVYRRSVDHTTVEFHKTYKVKVLGDELGTAYPDRFCRT